MVTEAELLERCQRGDAEAWNQLFDATTRRDVLFFSWGRISPAKTRRRFARKYFWPPSRTWIRSTARVSFNLALPIAANKARDYRKNATRQTRRGHAPVSLQARMPRPARRSTPADLPDRMNVSCAPNNLPWCKILEQLGEPCREIVELRYFGDLSYEELSATLNLNRKTVSSRLSKCLDGSKNRAKDFFPGEKRCFPVQPIVKHATGT